MDGSPEPALTQRRADTSLRWRRIAFATAVIGSSLALWR